MRRSSPVHNSHSQFCPCFFRFGAGGFFLCIPRNGKPGACNNFLKLGRVSGRYLIRRSREGALMSKKCSQQRHSRESGSLCRIAEYSEGSEKRRGVSDASMEIPLHLRCAAWIPTFVGMTNLVMNGKQAPASVNCGKCLYFCKESDCEEFSLDSGAPSRK